MYIYLYLSILKETFIIWGIQGIMYIYMYLSILKEAFNLKNFSKIERELLLKEAFNLNIYIYIYIYMYLAQSVKFKEL